MARLSTASRRSTWGWGGRSRASWSTACCLAGRRWLAEHAVQHVHVSGSGTNVYRLRQFTVASKSGPAQLVPVPVDPTPLEIAQATVRQLVGSPQRITTPEANRVTTGPRRHARPDTAKSRS